jgi:hypothetical protein
MERLISKRVLKQFYKIKNKNFCYNPNKGYNNNESEESLNKFNKLMKYRNTSMSALAALVLISNRIIYLSFRNIYFIYSVYWVRVI